MLGHCIKIGGGIDMDIWSIMCTQAMMTLSAGDMEKWECTSVLQLESHIEHWMSMAHANMRVSDACWRYHYIRVVLKLGLHEWCRRCGHMGVALGVEVMYLALFSTGIQRWEWWWAENVLLVNWSKRPHWVHRGGGELHWICATSDTHWIKIGVLHIQSAFKRHCNQCLSRQWEHIEQLHVQSILWYA